MTRRYLSAFVLYASIIHIAALMMPKSKGRIELFFKDSNDLRERVRLLRARGFQAFNLVNKNKKDSLQEWVQCIYDEYPDCDVCTHYSLKYNKIARKGIKEHSQRLQEFIRESTAKEVLIINGSGEKSPWDTISALDSLKSEQACGIDIAVAYNPYFPQESDQMVEKRRLNRKLNSGLVKKVYLQFGTDLTRLQEALEMLQKEDIAIAGSIFLPTARLIAQQKFRPWNGVFLGRDFLSGPETATSIVIEILKLYRKYDVEPLWEAPGIRTEKDLGILESLVAALENDKDMERHVPEFGYEVKKRATALEPAKVSEDKEVGGSQLITKKAEPAVVVFGSHDVRLVDNRALESALESHTRILPVFLWTKQPHWGVRGALEVVLQEALISLDATLRKFDMELVCKNCSGDGNDELLEIVRQTGAAAVFWNREHTPESRQLEKQRKSVLKRDGIEVHEYQTSLLYDPDKIELESGFHGGHWGTLMPFLKNCKKVFGEPRRPTPKFRVHSLLLESKRPDVVPTSIRVNELNMAKVIGRNRWDVMIRERFPMGEEDSQKTLEKFFLSGLRRYEMERSRSDKELSTSKLSMHLRIGTLSPNDLYWRTEDSGLTSEELKTFSRRLFWRELAYYQLRCFPDMRDRPIRKHYEKMEWVTGEELKTRLEAWKWGKTGFPIVDAGMRELYATGWMTQSIRMVAASFLVEYLRVPWQEGAEWFHYTLVDADSAINPMMWNNAGKSGIDQWNFVLSPVTASQDPSGSYTKRWVPELAALPTVSALHRPWEVPKEVLEECGIVLGITYPERIVKNLKEERKKSIESTLNMRRQSQEENSDRGYDLIRLPNGQRTVVFTKKEYRIDAEGKLLNAQGSKKLVSKRKTSARKSKPRSKAAKRR